MEEHGARDSTQPLPVGEGVDCDAGGGGLFCVVEEVTETVDDLDAGT